MQQNMTLFIQTQKQKQLLMIATLMMYLNQFMVESCQTYKNYLEKVHVGLLIQSEIIILLFQSTIL